MKAAVAWSVQAFMAAIAGSVAAASAAPLIDSRIVGTWTISESDCAAARKIPHGQAAIAGGGALIVSSFIITKRSIDTPAGRCTVVATHSRGDVISLSLECWNSVSVEERNISIKVIGPNEIEYQYPRTPELSQRFMRCKPSA